MGSHPRARIGNQRRTAQADPARRVVERDVEVIVGFRGRPLREYIGGDGLWHSEQLKGLIEKVRAEIVPDAAAGLLRLAPARLDCGSEAIPMRLVERNCARPRQDPLQGQEIGVPAPIVEDSKYSRLPLGQRDKRVGLRRRDRERLIDDHMFAGFERGLRYRKVSCVRRGDHDEVGRIEQCIERLDSVRRLARGLNHRKLHPPAGADQGRVKHRSGEPIANQADADRHRFRKRGWANIRAS